VLKDRREPEGGTWRVLPPVILGRRSLLWAFWAWLKRDAHDALTTLLLALSALATSWSSYQASIWGGIQSAYYSRSGGARAHATHAADDAARLRIVDIAMFLNWLQAYADGHTRLRAFYETRFRPEFRPAFNAWLANDPLSDSTGSTPFQRPEYKLAKDEEAARLDRESARLFALGQQANDNSDGYVFNTVILATVLFFSGTVGQVRSSRSRALLLAMACGMFVVAAFRLALAPVAH